MVRYISIGCLILGLAACTTERMKDEQSSVAAISSANEVVLPVLHIQPETYDLGDILEGEAAIATFLVRNNSQQNIELVDIQTSCGCTAAEPDSYIIAPNGFTQLKVAVDTTAKQQDIKKVVHVTDSSGHKATATLRFNVVENPHFTMKQRGVKSIFDGQCASCHFKPLVGVKEPHKLYEIGCAMCHGEEAEGAYAPKLRGHKLAYLKQIIAHGMGNRQMPGFARADGGPLTDAQIESLAAWLQSLPELQK